MLKRVLCTAAALSAPGIALTVASERILRPRLFYTGAWHPDPPDGVEWPYEEAAIFTPDGRELQGWFFRAKRSDAPTLLFCHGTSYNASDMWLGDERTEAFHQFLRGVGCNFLIFDYRGYGRDDGSASEEGTYLDAAAALAWLHQRMDVDPNTIFFYGFSLGTGVAAELAIREPSAGLILRAPFTSIRRMILDWYPRLRPLLMAAPWLPLTNYDTLSKIRRLDRPLLVMHGEDDETVPEYMGQQIFAAAPEPKMYVAFPGTGHRDFATDLVVPAITQFVDGVLAGTFGQAPQPKAAASA
ncbi:MAG: alpha/beta hydrolase [Chloroflexi bacterium]|nr:alpha/beta hydrolase [Chloroflexota bacterium]